MATEALLAPVPADLLEDALKNDFTTVAFGSMAWDFFQRLDQDHPNEPIDVLLYGSHESEFALEARWAGTYLGWRDASEAERDPSFAAQLRSPLARYDWAGNQEGGAWAIYWIVDGLHPLTAPVPLGNLQLPNGRKLSPAFIPRGPTRIQASEPELLR